MSINRGQSKIKLELEKIRYPQFLLTSIGKSLYEN
jgi:hypothetical protein